LGLEVKEKEKPMPLISPTQIGIVACLFLVGFWLFKGRKDVGSVVIVLVGCLVIWMIVLNWQTIVVESTSWFFPQALAARQVSANAVAHAVLTPAPVHPASQTLSVPLAPHQTHLGSKMTQGVPAHQEAAPPSFGQILEEGIGGVLAVVLSLLIGGLLAISKRARRCPNCGQHAPLFEHRWQTGDIEHLGRVCRKCIDRLQVPSAS
jgi:hypothetical protein